MSQLLDKLAAIAMSKPNDAYTAVVSVLVSCWLWSGITSPWAPLARYEHLCRGLGIPTSWLTSTEDWWQPAHRALMLGMLGLFLLVSSLIAIADHEPSPLLNAYPTAWLGVLIMAQSAMPWYILAGLSMFAWTVARRARAGLLTSRHTEAISFGLTRVTFFFWARVIHALHVGFTVPKPGKPNDSEGEHP